jgi:hypothetical protein
MASNPLSVTRKNTAPTQDPMRGHAQMWKHVNSMPSDDLATKAAEISYSLPILGALAGNPKVTSKNVIKATADAAGAGKMPPSKAVEIISQMPADPEKLQPWLKGLYAAGMTALVHMKAVMMREQASQGASAAPQPAQPGVPT